MANKPAHAPTHVAKVRQIGSEAEWTDWRIVQALTDRWGDLNDYHFKTPESAHLQDNPNLFERLREQMWDECTFIVHKDGEYGILFEVEYCSRESEVSFKGDDPEHYDSLLPHQIMVDGLKRGLEAICGHYPGVIFSMPKECHVVEDRPAVWAFVADGLLDAEQREALGRALLDIEIPDESESQRAANTSRQGMGG